LILRSPPRGRGSIDHGAPAMPIRGRHVARAIGLDGEVLTRFDGGALTFADACKPTPIERWFREELSNINRLGYSVGTISPVRTARGSWRAVLSEAQVYCRFKRAHTIFYAGRLQREIGGD
jgi:hypothetical protein